MSLELQKSPEAFFSGYKPERYWAVWQHPEMRYAYSVDHAQKGWLIAFDNERAGMDYLLADAEMNIREPSLYSLDELTLLDAIDEARDQNLPFWSTLRTEVVTVCGLLIATACPLKSGSLVQIPL